MKRSLRQRWLEALRRQVQEKEFLRMNSLDNEISQMELGIRRQTGKPGVSSRLSRISYPSVYP